MTARGSEFGAVLEVVDISDIAEAAVEDGVMRPDSDVSKRACCETTIRVIHNVSYLSRSRTNPTSEIGTAGSSPA
jgi:hypothetical protein